MIGSAWSAADLEALREMRSRRESWPAVALALGRTTQACQQMGKRLGLTPGAPRTLQQAEREWRRLLAGARFESLPVRPEARYREALPDVGPAL